MKIELSVGNITVLLLMVISISWLADRRGAPISAGLFAALAFLTKLYPGLLFVYYFQTSRKTFWWMTAWSFVLGVMAVLVFSLTAHVEYFATVAPQYQSWYSGPYNYSMYGFWYRLLSGFESDASSVEPLTRSSAAAAAAVIMTALLGMGCLCSARREKLTEETKDNLFAATITAMVLMSPISWRNTLLLLILPLFVLWSRYWRNPFIVAALASVSIVLWVHPLIWESYLRADGVHTYYPWESATHLSFKTYAMIALFCLAIRQARFSNPPVAASSAVPSYGE